MTDSPPSTPRGRRCIAVLVLVIVAIGSALGGAAIDRAYVHRMARIVGDTTFHPISSALRTPSAADRQQYLDELTDALSLTAEQRRVVDSITRHRAGEFETLRQSIRPRVESMIAEVRADVEKVLTPEQREKYRKLSPLVDSTSRQPK